MLKNPFLFWLDRLYGYLIKIGSNLQSVFLLYMRLTWGHQLFINGLLNPSIATGVLEIVLGSLVFIGLFSRLAAIPLILLSFVHLSVHHPEHIANLDFLIRPLVLVQKEPYPFLITGLLLFIFGPGRISCDAWIKQWIKKQPKY